MGSTKLWAIMSVFFALDGWHYRQKQILIGFYICWKCISLGTDAHVFCCNSTFHLSFYKMLQRRLHCLVETWIILKYFQKFHRFPVSLFSFFPIACFIFWFHLFVDFCQEIKFLNIFNILLSKTFPNLNRKKICICWKKHLSDKIFFYSECFTWVTNPLSISKNSKLYVILVTKGHVSKSVPYFFLFS